MTETDTQHLDDSRKLDLILEQLKVFAARLERLEKEVGIAIRERKIGVLVEQMLRLQAEHEILEERVAQSARKTGDIQ